MTIHFHGTPITPKAVLGTMHGKCFCVSFFAPGDVARCHEIGQAVLLDNGAFSAWKKGILLTAEWWARYYAWCERWLDRPTTFAIIPDVITGGVDEQDDLIARWAFGERGWPVWHMHEPIDRLLTLLDRWPRIAIGSSAQFAVVGSDSWHGRMDEAFEAITRRHQFMPWIHLLRGMQAVRWAYPFASVDSTDVARNHNRPGKTARDMADAWDAQQCPAAWSPMPEQISLFGGIAA